MMVTHLRTWAMLLIGSLLLLTPRLGKAQQIGSCVVSLGSQSVFVKEFPIVLRLTFRGPVPGPPSADTHAPTVAGFGWFTLVPVTTLFDSTANIDVVLTKIDKGHEQLRYTISSTRGQHMEVRGPMGIVSSGEQLFYVPLQDGEQRTMLLDVASLRPEVGKGLTLSDVPPGRYSLQVVVRNTSVNSNKVNITLESGSQKQLKFVQEVASQLGQVVPQSTVNWSDVLRKATKVSGIVTPLRVSDLGERPSSQLLFHQFLLNILSSQEQAQPKARLRDTRVPDYLKFDKESVLLELLIAQAKERPADLDKTLEQFIAVHPDLRWRIKAAQQGEAEFMPYLNKTRAGQ